MVVHAILVIIRIIISYVGVIFYLSAIRKKLTTFYYSGTRKIVVHSFLIITHNYYNLCRRNHFYVNPIGHELMVLYKR